MARKIMAPSKEENDRIDRGIASDPDTFEATAEDFARPRPARDVLPPVVYQEAVKRRWRQRGPQKAPVKQSVSLRSDPDLLTYFKAMGEGWQRRMNKALRRSMERPKKAIAIPSHRPGWDLLQMTQDLRSEVLTPLSGD